VNYSKFSDSGAKARCIDELVVEYGNIVATTSSAIAIVALKLTGCDSFRIVPLKMKTRLTLNDFEQQARVRSKQPPRLDPMITDQSADIEEPCHIETFHEQA